MTHVAQQTTTVITVAGARHGSLKRVAQERAALHEAGRHIIYVGLRYSESYRDRMSDRDRVIIKLSGYVAEAVDGFSVDLDALVTNELVSAYRIACTVQRRRLGHTATEAEVHRSAGKYVRYLWKKTARYLSQSEVKSALRSLADDALSSRDNSVKGQLARCERLHSRKLRLPDFDAVATRAAERDRNLMIEATQSTLAELTSGARAA